MDRQLRDFCIQQTTSSCCEGGHKDDDFCDRRIILRCISTWFGSIENFELRVQTEVRKALANQLVDGGFTYRRMVLATVPLLWSLLDRMASDVRDPLWAAGQMARLFAYWLTTVPSLLQVPRFLWEDIPRDPPLARACDDRSCHVLCHSSD
ncbi:unnamed protein product [Symbiodinium necroappetens]|uniref:Uncharacterized protein n=1 Tax=Symbiodinium necroappetens TaxID=1628268 RepID=A0A813BQI9_9DINO|nr:unnamed protein product [Symbiodinium necroappetens]